MLTKLQQDQLEKLRHWLTATEDRISQAGQTQLPESLASAIQLLDHHQALQQDLEAQQEYVNALSNMVVIVDESAGDSEKYYIWIRVFITFHCAIWGAIRGRH